ncbi:MAG: restriction endonuclease [Clostridium perfringens]|nr:restriction endonuclease [Clostridium perfringens]
MHVFQKDIIDSMKECILSIFWAKNDIIDFFNKSGCTLRDIPKENEVKELTRKGIIDKVFFNLQIRADEGIGQVRAMMKSLIEWDYFNPYYFNELKKLDIKVAKENINHLKKLQDSRDSKIKNERKRREDQEKKKRENKKSIEELKNYFFTLYSGKDKDGKSINIQRRGYLFESFLKEVCLSEDIKMNEGFKIQGEQIDGVIKYEGENYIVEAKWTDNFSTTEALYKFACKVEGKMYGRGIFISINGFLMDSVNALINRKALKTILIDGTDLVYVVEQRYSLKEMLDIKIREAQTKGRIYVDISTLKEKK